MNDNEKYFKNKFNECAKYLKTKSDEIISLKYREMRDHQYYLDLLDGLHNIKSVKVDDIGNNMNGRAYRISYGSQKIIIVEHETGLEILYIVGSIAGIIGLILQISSSIGNHRRNVNFYNDDFRDVEIRYFDKNGKFVEQHRHNYLPYEVFLLPPSNDKEIESLNKRIDILEKKIKELTKGTEKTKKRK